MEMALEVALEVAPVIELRFYTSHYWAIFKRVMGIEPTLFAWEARVLPLNDTRIISIVGVVSFCLGMWLVI